MGPDTDDPAATLKPAELYWRDHYEWLFERGYTLRSRYKPDWVPSWRGRDISPYSCEDGYGALLGRVLDAVRQSNGSLVLLKCISVSVHPNEIPIAQYLTSPPLSDDPRNHCCPVLEVLDDPLNPDTRIIVMPHLRKFNDPRFQTVGEAIDFCRQSFEGLHFIHEHGVAHRDAMTLNIMLDPSHMYPQMYHPRHPHLDRDWNKDAKFYSRTRRPSRYLWIDFGLSSRYEEGVTAPSELPIWGGDHSVPEFEDFDMPRNPFPTDVYTLGNIIREEFAQKYSNFTFLHTLIALMTDKDPTRRPTMSQASEELEKIVSKLPRRILRARLRSRRDNGLLNFLKDVQHFFRTMLYIFLCLPPIPTPPPSVPAETKRNPNSVTQRHKTLAIFARARSRVSTAGAS